MERDLLRLLPKVLRARDFHLYLEGGKRLVDLWLQGGRTVLGHKPQQVLRELKNAAERGLFTPFPHPMEGRFLKALEQIFPGRAFRLYPDSGSLHRALEEAGQKETASIWRPFFDTDGNEKKAPVLLPVLPWPLGPEVLVLEKSIEASFPEGELIPPVLLAPATRALYKLISAMESPGQGRLQYHKIENSLIDCPWQGRGIYIWLKSDMDMVQYKTLFLRFLEGGFLIPPSHREPLILPGSMSSGEESKLAELFLTP